MALVTANTLRYTFPVLASLADNTLTALTDITVYIPERVTAFRSVIAILTCDDIITATGGTAGTRRMQLGLGGGTKTNISNSNALANSGENLSLMHSFDFTARFTSDWTGTSMTCQADVLVDQTTGTTLGQVNVCVTLEITYEYDYSTYDITGAQATDILTSNSGGSPVVHGLDVGTLVRIKDMVGGSGASDGVYAVASVPTLSTFTLTGFSFTTDITGGTATLSPTRAKTIGFIMTTPATALASAKPGSANFTIPALDTYLPEASKAYREITVEMLGNTHGAASDPTMSMEYDTAGAHTTGNYESALATSRMVRYCTSPSYFGAMDTSTTHSWYIWASTTLTFYHCVCTMYVTYEYDEDSTTDMIVAVIIPVNQQGDIGGSSASPSSLKITIDIQEENISGGQIACVWQWGQAAAVTGMQAKIGTGSYVAYTDGGSFYGGGTIASIRNDSAYTLARGKNTLDFLVYRTGGDNGLGLSGYWRVSYTCDKPAAGTQAANKTIIYTSYVIGTRAANFVLGAQAQQAAYIPEPLWYMNSWGCFHWVLQTGTASPGAIRMGGLLDSGAPFTRFVGTWIGTSDAEAGWRLITYAPDRFVWKWANYKGLGLPSGLNDPSDPTDIYSLWAVAVGAGTVSFFQTLQYVYTYHGITYPVTADVSGSAGGTVTLHLHRESDGERLATTTRTGDGSYTFTWYDNTENVYVDAYEDNTHLGRSVPALAGT